MRTMQDLMQMQALPLDVKVKMTKRRIRDWVNEYGEDGVYVSFSGGKDSTALLHIVREEYPNIPAVFVDTGLEYPEIRQFVKTFDNVEWLKPKMNFKKVIEKYGYPFIGKEVSEKVYYAQKYLKAYYQKTELPSAYGIMELAGIKRKSDLRVKCQNTRNVPEEILREFAKTDEKGTFKIRQLIGDLKATDGSPSQFNYTKYKWMAMSPYMISNKCCHVMKKEPAKAYEHKTGKHPMTAMMAQESRLRTLQWLKNGCNAFDAKKQVSNPMAFWTEQDVLLYIYQNNIPVCSVYGDVVKVTEMEGQLDLEDVFGKDVCDLGTPTLKTTGCKRTGCMFCGYGCHLEKPGEGRFERMKVTHPKQYEYIMKPWEEGGLNYKAVIDWLNENGNLHIRY